MPFKLYFQTYYMHVNELQALYCNRKSIYYQKKIKIQNQETTLSTTCM